VLNPAIAYVQQQTNGMRDVVVAAADLGSQVVLTQSLQKRYRLYGSPAWSADGMFVAFWSQDYVDRMPTAIKLFVARADASEVRLVRDFNTQPDSLAPSFTFAALNWSPSGKELVYKSAIIDVATGETRLWGAPWHPALSPDLDREKPGYQGFLATTDNCLHGSIISGEIFIVAIEDDEDGYLLPLPEDPDQFINVTNDPDSPQYHPSWSPDGTQLACFDDEWLAVIDLVTGERTRLSPNYATGVTSSQDRAAWTSDARALVFRSWDIGSGADLAIIAADGSSPVVNYTATKNLTEQAPAWNPQWDPAGPGGF